MTSWAYQPLIQSTTEPSLIITAHPARTGTRKFVHLLIRALPLILALGV